jgi:hypothetical protein
MADESATYARGPDAGLPPGEPAEGSPIAELRAELEASLAAGFVPNGWTHRISWESDGPTHIAAAIVVIVIGVAAGWLTWGWRAGLAVGMVAIGLGMLLSMRGGPRPGDTITESFIPPDENLITLGLAGHELGGSVGANRSSHGHVWRLPLIGATSA